MNEKYPKLLTLAGILFCWWLMAKKKVSALFPAKRGKPLYKSCKIHYIIIVTILIIDRMDVRNYEDIEVQPPAGVY